VNEVRNAMRAAQVKGPYVLVGLSLGAWVARLYAVEYPADVAGMVIVDHAFAPDPDPDPDVGKVSPNFAGLDSPPVLLEQTPIEFTVEEASHFENLPARAPAARTPRPVAPQFAMMAEKSFHAVEIDQPGVVIAAIRQVVRLAGGR